MSSGGPCAAVRAPDSGPVWVKKHQASDHPSPDSTNKLVDPAGSTRKYLRCGTRTGSVPAMTFLVSDPVILRLKMSFGDFFCNADYGVNL